MAAPLTPRAPHGRGGRRSFARSPAVTSALERPPRGIWASRAHFRRISTTYDGALPRRWRSPTEAAVEVGERAGAMATASAWSRMACSSREQCDRVVVLTAAHPHESAPILPAARRRHDTPAAPGVRGDAGDGDGGAGSSCHGVKFGISRYMWHTVWHTRRSPAGKNRVFPLVTASGWRDLNPRPLDPQLSGHLLPGTKRRQSTTSARRATWDYVHRGGTCGTRGGTRGAGPSCRVEIRRDPVALARHSSALGRAL